MKTYSSIPASEVPESPSSYLRMFVLGLIVIAPSAFSGIMTVYPAIAIPEMNLSISEISWFGSMSMATAPVGSILIGCIIDKLGRRTALLVSVFPTLLGWILLSWNRGLAIVLAGQALNGISCGAILYPAQVYASECIMVNDLRWRDNYLSWLGIGSACGMCFALLLAYFCSYRTVAAISATSAFLVFLLIYAFIPESPAWLYRQGRLGDAEWSESKLGISQPILRAHKFSSASHNKEELPDEQQQQHQHQQLHQHTSEATNRLASIDTKLMAPATVSSYLEAIRRKDVYKPLLIMCGAFILLTFGGAVNVMIYLVNIMGENDVLVNGTVPANVSISAAAVHDIRLSESYKYSAVAGILILISNCLVCAIVSRVGVKRILSGACLFIALGFCLLGFTTTQTDYRADLHSTHILAIWLIIFAFSFGAMNLPNSILGNIFPAEAKGFASIVCVLEFVLTAFLVKIHPYLRISFGGYLYYGYAGVSILGAVYIAVFMVDTVGKTMDEIKREFLGK